MIGNVELIEHMGSDLSIVNAARVSLGKQSSHSCEGLYPYWHVHTVDCYLDKDKGLIRYLLENKHGTPLEMVVLKFRVKCPIGVAREWQRHRISSFNEISTRYVPMEPEFYLPDKTHVRTQVGRPGHYKFEMVDTIPSLVTLDIMGDAYRSAYSAYEKMLGMGVAKELARNVLPLGLMTEFIWCVNLRSLLNFLSLRMDKNALLEIRELASRVYIQTMNVVPVALNKWDDLRRPNGDDYHDCDACDYHDETAA